MRTKIDAPRSVHLFVQAHVNEEEKGYAILQPIHETLTKKGEMAATEPLAVEKFVFFHDYT